MLKLILKMHLKVMRIYFKMVKAYEIGRKCCICDKDKWIALPDKLFIRIFILTSTVNNCKHICIKNKLIGIGHGIKEICIPCLILLIGLENYYDKFYFEFLDDQKAKNIINYIKNDKKLLNDIAKIRSKGKYIPNEIINNIIESIKSDKGEILNIKNFLEKTQIDYDNKYKQTQRENN
jgi:hypothetical protein